ncbi:DUF1329 domain-containing protein [Aquabacterium sp.]|uniref:DUF1329 domain-containing protein n=1 Tax=Aquabacterium sp. TaxID=1872578 RepID=UPI0025BE5932|nr:DUF1329 domain-containing protein [Aquabacterium sp.]
MNTKQPTFAPSKRAAILGLCVSSLMSLAHAAVDADRLGKDLTPSGAERAGNKDGSIPEWTGGLTKPPAGYKAGGAYVDPFAGEKPLFQITGQNLEKYKDKVSPGMQALLKKYPHLSMPVYRTHRTFANPQSVYDATKAMVGKVMLKGLTLQNYTMPGTPFPVPSNGVEAMYNHLTHFFGSYNRCADWLPVRPNGDYYRVGFCEDMVQGQNFDQRQPNHVFSFYGAYDAPATLVGTIYLVHDPVDYSVAGRQAWIYNAGQRRVRRAPDLAYDAASDGDEGMRTADDYWGFNGALDRYEWKLAGKREMYIPYNAYKANDKSLKYKDMIDKGSLKSDLLRYELHRVWEVQATLKTGMSHVYAKRTFFIDEDSNTIALADHYDSRGNLWRTHVLSLVQAYDANVMFQAPWIQHDLISGSYIVEGLTNERKEATVWNEPKKWSDFQVDAIRRKGVR